MGKERNGEASSTGKFGEEDVSIGQVEGTVGRVPSPMGSTSGPDVGVGGSSFQALEDGLSSRDTEKSEMMTKQREKYLGNGEGDPSGRSGGGMATRLNYVWKVFFSDIDSHAEHLYYVLAVELFFIFLTYTHYPRLDKKNRFLTPIVMGGETSLLGETLTQLHKWGQRKISCGRQREVRTLLRQTDEEMSLGAGRELGSPKLAPPYRRGGLHSRNPSEVDKIMSSPLPIDPAVLRNAIVREHFKFLCWGGLNGLLSSYWIEFVISLSNGWRLLCVGIDQSVGTVIFQTLYSLFLCLWDGEIEIGTDSDAQIDLTWESFIAHYSGMLWKYMKLSWTVWPFISLISFTVLNEDWIFPLNCICTTIFTVILQL